MDHTRPGGMESSALVCLRSSRKTSRPQLGVVGDRLCIFLSTRSRRGVLLSLQGGCLIRGKYKPATNGSYCELSQNSVPVGMEKIRSQVFPNIFLQCAVMSRGQMNRWVWWGLLCMAFPNCSSAAPAPAGGGVQTQIFLLCPR
jgi:hypothetical protein